MTSWHKIAALFVLVTFVGISVGVISPLTGGGASSEPNGDVATPSAEDAEEESHRQSRGDLGPLLKQVEFVEQFAAAGSDASTLPLDHTPDLGFDEAKNLATLRDRSVAIVRGTVIAQSYFATALVDRGTAQMLCYSILTVRTTNKLKGDVGQDITVVTDACPNLRGETPVLTHSSWDPPLFQGREYFMFLKPGDDSSWKITSYPEGHSAAGDHYHLEDPSAHFEVIDGKTNPTEFATGWARALDGATVTEFEAYVADPSTAPPPVDTQP